AVRNTLSPETTGVLTPAPWRGIFQRTFWVRDQRVGRFFSADTPEPPGPRQPGQSPAGISARAPSSKREPTEARHQGRKPLRRAGGVALALSMGMSFRYDSEE